MRKCLRESAGFTLLELLVVLLIIGLLASYVGPKYFAQIGNANIKTAKAQIDAFDKALDQFRLDTGHYPNTNDGLNALYVKPSDEAKWNGPYTKKAIPLDPWGHPYAYASPGKVDPSHEYEVISYGRDGEPGGSGEDADINSWE